jgi:hypothetical protein
LYFTYSHPIEYSESTHLSSRLNLRTQEEILGEQPEEQNNIFSQFVPTQETVFSTWNPKRNVTPDKGNPKQKTRIKKRRKE